jgi:hypothetical protein
VADKQKFQLRLEKPIELALEDDSKPLTESNSLTSNQTNLDDLITKFNYRIKKIGSNRFLETRKIEKEELSDK